MPNFEKPNLGEAGPPEEENLSVDALDNTVENEKIKEKPEKESNKSTERETHCEFLLFEDEQTAKVFRTPGDTVEWRMYSIYPGSRIIIKTSSGNRYIIGDLIIVNEKEHSAKVLGNEEFGTMPNITIGEPWGLPGVFQTTSVESVWIQGRTGKTTRFGNKSGTETNEKNPFPEANKLLRFADENLE